MKVSASSTTKKGIATARPILGWAIIGILLFGAIVNYLDRTNLSLANPLIAAQFHLSPVAMGALLSLFLWPYAIANVLSGWLVDRIGSRKVFSLAIGLWSAVTVATAFATTYLLFGALRILLGITESPFFPAGLKAADHWFPRNQKALAISIFNTGPQVALAVAAPVLTLLMLSLGWPGMFIVTGLSGFLVLIAWLLFTWIIARLPRESVSLRSSAWAGLIAAIGFEVFKQVASIYLQAVLHGPAGATFGPVLGLMVFAYITARLILFATAWAATSTENLAVAPVEPPGGAQITTRVQIREGLGVRGALAAAAMGALGALSLSRLLKR